VDRRKAVERDGGNAGSASARRQGFDRITNHEIERQLIGMTAVKDIAAVPRPVEITGSTGAIVARRVGNGNGCVRRAFRPDRYRGPRGVNPARAFMLRSARNEQDLGEQKAGIADQLAARVGLAA
jgi:hypothetical protein